MSFIRDEILVAFADGMLADADCHTVERLIHADPDAQRSVYLFTLTRRYIRQIFDEIDFTEISSKLTAVVDQASGQQRALRSAIPRLNGIAWMIPLAASFVLALSFGVTALTEFNPRSDRAVASKTLVLGSVSRDTSLLAALNHGKLPGMNFLAHDGSRFVDVAQFRDKFGNLCREIEIYGAQDRKIPGEIVLACRNAERDWSIVGAVTTYASGSERNGHYVPSEGEARKAMDGVLSMIGAQQRTFSAETEMILP